MRKLAALALLCLPTAASSYTEVTTHPEITKRGANLLVTSEGGYREISRYTADMAEGSRDEDFGQFSLWTVVVTHFYDPSTGSGLSRSGVTFPQSAVERGRMRWNEAILSYTVYRNRPQAYHKLGHALHLLAQDLAQPGHAHNDPHIPFASADLSALEKFAEQQAINSIGTFPVGTAVRTGDPTRFPPTSELTPEDFGVEQAARTHQASRFVGQLNRATGIGFVNVGTNRLDAVFDPSDSSGLNCMSEPHWELAGKFRALCFDPNRPHDGVEFSNDWWEVPGRLGPNDPLLAAQLFYIDQYDEVNHGEEGLTFFFYRTLIPEAINTSAGLMKLFAQTVDPVRPTVQLRRGNEQGSLIPPGGVGSDTIYVKAVDPSATEPGGDAKYPTPSGIYQMELRRVGGSVIEPSPAISAEGETAAVRTFPNLAEGDYELEVVDGFQNSRKVRFSVSVTPPELKVESGQGVLRHGARTEDTHIKVTATVTKAPILGLEFFRDGAPFVPEPKPRVATYAGNLPEKSWYYVRACDVALNCVYSLFGIWPPGFQPPAPPMPPSPPPGGNQRPNVPDSRRDPPIPPNPPQEPYLPPQPGPLDPECLVSSPDPAVSKERCWESPPAPPRPELPPSACRTNPARCRTTYRRAHDPNAKYGPTGSVMPGQLMTYTVEFENEGDGTALDVFVKDVLDRALDDSTLTLREMQRVDFLNKVETPASFPWSYDARTRTVTVLTGDAEPRQGGRFILEARLKADAAPGTVISNQAVVHFPNVLEITPTNSIVSAVPLPTQIAYLGDVSGTYQGTSALSAQLMAGGKPVTGQPLEFSFSGATFSAVTDQFGVAATTGPVSNLPGTYTFSVRYAGDQFYYLAGETQFDFTVHKKPVLLQPPLAAARRGEPARLPVELTDDGRPLEAQLEDPKTILIELLNEGEPPALLASSLLSGTSASFEIALPQPLRLSWPIRARFDGDTRYQSAAADGTLRLIDDSPPAITIRSPRAGDVLSGSFTVDFAVDDADAAPIVAAALNAAGGELSIPVQHGQTISSADLPPGSWTLDVFANDWAGNASSVTSGAFQIVTDARPPRTTLLVGEPKAGSEPIFVSSITPLSFDAVDDRLVAGDGLGMGVAETRYSVDTSTFQELAGSFTLTGEGPHIVSWFSRDVVGNTEATQSASLTVDLTAPRTLAAFSAPAFVDSSGRWILGPGTEVRFLAEDSASGVGRTLFALDQGTFAVAGGTITAPAGTSFIRFFSEDRVGNAEAVQSTAVVVDATAPDVALLSPAAGSVGIDRIFNAGAVPVYGTVSDLHLSSYTLEFAAGVDAQSGFTPLAAGTTAANGLLGTWNASALSGIFTLRLTGFDSLGNVGVSSTTVFIGEPAVRLILHNSGKALALDKPEGVATDAEGNIYIANTGRDEVLKFGPDGAFGNVFDGSTTPGPGKLGKGGGDDDHRKGTFKRPTGIALDAASNIYVADRDNDRIAVLDPSGAVVRSIGKKNHRGLFLPGKGPGEFNKPTGVAVSKDRLAVADRNNGRVQVFDLSGAFILQVKLDSAAPARRRGDDDEDEEDDDGGDEPKPFGVALDADNNIYVTDEENGRLLAFDPQGRQLFVLDADRFDKPQGVAASVLKYLYVADRERRRVQKFDPFHNPALTSGSSLGLKKPVGLALDGAGFLYVTDRDADRVLKLGLPEAGVPVVVVPPHEKKRKKLKVSASGGKVERDDRVKVVIPPDALKQELEVTIEPEKQTEPAEEEAKKRRREEKKLLAVAEGVEYGPEGTKFERAVTITLAYNPAALPPGVKEDELKVYYWNPVRGEWEPYPSTVDKQAKTVSAQTTHFSLYQIMAPQASGGGVGPAAAVVDSSFALRDIFVFPNPARGGAKPTLHVEVGLADKVTVRIYDVAGRELLRKTFDQAPTVIDSGSGPRYAYEYVWDGAIASGVYLYVVEAEKAGYAPIRKAGKLGVVR